MTQEAGVAGAVSGTGDKRVSGWIVGQLMAERERWSLWAPVGLGTGIAVYFALPVEPPLWLGLVGLILSLALALGLRRQPAGLLLALALALGAAGFAVAQWRTARVAAPILQDDFGPAMVTGQVLSIEPRADGGRGPRVVLRQPDLPGLSAAQTPAKVRIRMTARDPLTPTPGDWIALRAALRPPPEPSAPGAFDFARRAFFQRLGGVGYAVGHAQQRDPPENPAAEAGEPGIGATAWQSWQLWWSGLRRTVTERVLQALPGRAGAVAAALMTGERGAIPEEVIVAMRDSGLAHLLAISGLHLGLVAGLLFFTVRAGLALVPLLALNYPIKKCAAAVAGCGAFGYLMLVGATVPTQRAFVMVALALLAVMTDRNPISLRLVAWAAAAVLLLSPESLLGASFQMSFAAVTALVAAYESLGERGPRAFLAERSLPQRVALYLAGVSVTSVIAIAATSPFAIYHFNRMAWYGLAANLIAVPLTAFWIMPAALLAFVLMPFGLERLALAPMGWGIEGVILVAERVASWPGAVRAVQAMPLSGLAAVVLGGLWLCLWRRPWRLAGLLGIAVGLASIPLTPPPDVLISGNARLWAVRTAEGGVWLSTERRERFTADLWLRRAGRQSASQGQSPDTAATAGLACDPLGCLLDREGQRVAVVLDGRALFEDCGVATLLISLEPVPRRRCPEPDVVIDRFDLWREGAHAIWLRAGEIEVESVAGRRGDRPWSVPRGRSSGDGSESE